MPRAPLPALAALLLAPLAACQKPEPMTPAVEAHSASGEDGVHEPRQPGAPLPSGAIRVALGAQGFEPARLPVKAGQAVQLAFHREAAARCGDRVVFPALKLERPLPAGQTVLVQVLAPTRGELAFSCGAAHGALVVE